MVRFSSISFLGAVIYGFGLAIIISGVMNGVA